MAEASLSGFLSPDREQILSDIASKLGEQINTRITIIALDGTVLGDSEEDPATMENHAARPEIRDALNLGFGESTRYSTTLEQKMMYVAVPISHQGEVLGTARVALPLTEVESLERRITVSIATAMAIAALLVILAAWVIARVTTRPIREITAASKKIASGELEQKINMETGGEVEELAHSFNEMSSKLKELVDTISGDKARLETILDNMADGVIMTDKEGNILLANRAVKKLFKMRDAVNKPLIEAVRDYEVDELLKLCIQRVEVQDTQYESGTANRFLRAIAVPITSYKPGGVLILFQDLTDIRNLQTTRRDLIGNISHEFRTPLAGIKAMVETLQDGAVDDKKAAEDFLAKIATEDDEVDDLYDQVFRELLSFMIEDPKTITKATRLVWVAHNLERSADRVTNICERVVFFVTGKMEEIGASKY
jgi:two-component system phosphate regulon sensor histidine kinase PhoR